MYTENIKPNLLFAKKIDTISTPCLLKTQKLAYNNFLYSRKKENIQSVLNEVFPIKNTTKTVVLECTDYTLEPTKLNVAECVLRGVSYEASLKINTKLTVFTKKTKKIIYTDTQQIHLCDIPLMTKNGSFIINGTERVVISQLCRSPGAYYSKVDENIGESYALKIIPATGAWLEITIDQKNTTSVRIDKKKKIPLTTFLLALGVKQFNLVNMFTSHSKIFLRTGKKTKSIMWYIEKNTLKNTCAPFTVRVDRKPLFKKYDIVRNEHIKKISNNSVVIQQKDLMGKVIVHDVYCEKTKKIIVPEGSVLTENILAILENNNVCTILVAHNDKSIVHNVLKTLEKDTTQTQEQALIKIHKIMRPGEPSSVKVAKKFFKDMLFNVNTYNLSNAGRVKINQKTNTNSNEKTLTLVDILTLLSNLFKIKSYHNNKQNNEYYNENTSTKEFFPVLDEIDNIGNKKIKHVGDLVLNQLRLGLLRIKKPTKEKLMSAETSKLRPKNVLTTTAVTVLMKDFFCTSQLSQFMDQNNPLSTVTHKRRVSSTGPGGLTRDRANIEARDVHITNYGKICPIETPEGKNIGLVHSLSIYAKLDKNGFLTTPYNTVVDRTITNNIKYLTAHMEQHHAITHCVVSKTCGKLIDDTVVCRLAGEFTTEHTKNISYIDVSTNQMLSVATALIPFLQHNDANRALMGSNMQRQSVPTITPEIPFVCTGLECVVARDSGSALYTNKDALVRYVDSSKVTLEFLQRNTHTAKRNSLLKTYDLEKYKKSNQNTCINQKPIITRNTYLKKNTVFADGQATKNGTLALGKNILVAYLPWYGYNFEDSIVVSEKLVESDKLSTINVDTFTCLVKNTKLGLETITNDIPGATPADLRNLDITGIVKEGTHIIPGDILVGKVTPTEEKRQTPEERLLCAVFGERAEKVHNTSLVAPAGVYGVVTKVVSLSKDCFEKSNNFWTVEKLKKQKKNFSYLKLQQHRILRCTEYYMEITQKKIPLGFLKTTPIQSLRVPAYVNFLTTLQLKNIILKYYVKTTLLYTQIEKTLTLPQGIVEAVTVFITTKRKLKPGDKLSGRHGNKGVVSSVVPTEDMPHLQNGKPIEMLLNPLSIPSRMNVGQLLEVQLGWAIKTLKDSTNYKRNKEEQSTFLLEKLFTTTKNKAIKNNKITNKEISTIVTPTFNGITEKTIKNILKLARLPKTGKTYLVDGTSGMQTREKVSVGYTYMLKLNHLADDKLHARSTGPYNIITQQPLGGKSHFGGQRFGEMEVWALEAYGAAYTLQEMITVKADDLTGRTKIFKNIVDGNHKTEPTLPESFKVLVEEIKALGLKITLNK